MIVVNRIEDGEASLGEKLLLIETISNAALGLAN